MCLTCSEEHDLVLAVLSGDAVHHDLRERVLGAHQLEDGPAVQREHRAVHQRVEAHEADHLIGEVLGGLDLRVVRLAGALRGREGREGADLVRVLFNSAFSGSYC